MFAVVCLINGNASPLAIRVNILSTIVSEGMHVGVTILLVLVL
jgi:hypothetical protein